MKEYINLESKIKTLSKKSLKSGCFIIIILMVLSIALTGCSNNDKTKSGVKTKKAKSIEAVDKEKANKPGSVTSKNIETSSDKTSKKKNTVKREKAKYSEKKKAGSSSSNSSGSSAPAKQKVWVPATGHYETVMVIKCNCGREFATVQEHAEHQNAYLEEMRRTDPTFQCQGKHLARRVPKQVWKEDTPGHYEYK